MYNYKLLSTSQGFQKEGRIAKFSFVRLNILALSFIIFLSMFSCSLFTPESSGQTLPVKVLISEDGLYTIKAKDLKNVGVDVENINLDELKMIYKGRDVSVWVEGVGNKLEIKFYGLATDSKYTSLNAYFLVFNDEQRGHLEDGYKDLEYYDKTTPGGSGVTANLQVDSIQQDAYIATKQLEENLLYVPQVEDGDTWMWDSLTAPQKELFEIVLNNLEDSDGKLTIELWASTEAVLSPDHHILAAINNHLIVEEFWDGVGRFTIETVVPPGVLQDGQNILSLESPGDTGVVVDIIYLDRIKLEYPRQLVAIDDRLEFVSDGKSQQLTGFSGKVSIFEITDPYNVILESRFDSGQDADNFNGTENKKYLALGPGGMLSPEKLIPIPTNMDLFDPINAADYVVIGPSDLLESMQPLLDHRDSQGFKVKAVPVDLIYNHFSYGMPEPEGIRLFLRYAYQTWDTAPKYVILVGDATYDPLGYISDQEVNRLPSFMVNTTYGGETASDTLFAQMDDDLLPDLAVGRVPARDSKQVQIFVEKLIAYENQTEKNDWQRRILAIADTQDPIFKASAEAFLDQFSSEYQTDLIALEENINGGGAQVKDEIEKGSLIVSYFGHGSIDIWGKNQLFTAGDAAELHNEDRLPVVMTMTCLNGLFTHPEVESLAEALLWNSNGGAVAALAPTSLTLTTDQILLSRAIIDTIAENPEYSLGEILLNAQREIPDENHGAVEVMLTFLLFGDPATRLVHP